MMIQPQFELSYFDAGGKVLSAVPVPDGTFWSCPEAGLYFTCDTVATEYGTVFQIPADSIRETGRCRFKDLVLHLDGFEVSGGTGASIFIPWGSGFLCDTGGLEEAEYLLPIFGERKYVGVWGNMPLFGLQEAGRFRLGLVEGGKFDCDLRLRVAWGKQKKYGIAPVFLLRDRPGDALPDEDLSVRSVTLEGNWKDAAKWYRRYNTEVRKLPPIAGRVSREPDLEYSAKALTLRCRMCVKPLPAKILEQTPENEPEPRVFMTFNDVRVIARELKRQDVGPVEFNLVGWNHGGHDGAFPQLFPAAEVCGGEANLERLIPDINEIGYRISLHDNYYDGYSLARNFHFDDICRNGGPELGGGRLGGGQAYRICPEKAIRYAEENFREVKRRMPGLRGPYYNDVISIGAMKKCDHPSHPVTRRQNSQYYKRILQMQHDEFGLSMSEGSRDWALPELDRSYLIFGAVKNNLPFCDEHIPFFQMVYHGFLLYNNARNHINAFPGTAGYVENIAWGGMPIIYFHHIFNLEWANSSAWKNDLKLEGPEELKQDVAIFKQMSDDVLVLATTQESFIEDVITYSAVLGETVYSNGMRVIVNKGEMKEKTPDGTEIAPFSFVLQTDSGTIRP